MASYIADKNHDWEKIMQKIIFGFLFITLLAINIVAQNGQKPCSQKEAFQFDPDAIFVMTVTNEATYLTRKLPKIIKSGGRIDEPYLQEILQRAGVTDEMADGDIVRRLTPVREELVSRAYQRLEK